MPLPTEEQLIASGRGKWGTAGVPHKGWECIDIEDLGEPELQCEMCESQTIRYVHYMKHANYSAVLAVGCVCAGHMEDDLIAAKERETSMRNRGAKRSRWTTRKWKLSTKGNETIKSDGFRVTVYQRGSGYGATIASLDSDRVQHARRNYETIDRAKLAAFDHITRVLAKQR